MQVAPAKAVVVKARHLQNTLNWHAIQRMG